MSNFTYEIDERNLRLQMKEFTVPVKEDAWQKFEAFTEGMVSQQRSGGLKSFNLSLNRSVVLPSVFAVIIILFSFLLVNFVSIKNPAKDNDQKAEATTVTAPAPHNQPKTEQTVPVAPKDASNEPALATATIADIKPEEKAMINALVSAPESASEQTTETTEAPAENIASEEVDTKAKRRARRRAEAVELQKLQEIRPTPVSEERDVEEIRPD